MMMNSKKWIKIVLVFVPLAIGFVGGVNYIVDPLWNFTHKFSFNSKESGFDERQQKTNLVNTRNMDRYDGILLGSSRTTHINQNDFKNMNIFNYASSSMHPFEYKGYIDFFKKNKKKKLKYIIIGTDFYGIAQPRNIKFKRPEFYIHKTESFMYKFKILFSFDTFKKSLQNLKLYLIGGKEYYDRNNIKYVKRVAEEERLDRYTTNLKRHTNSFMNPNYKYNTDLINIYKSLKNDNPNTKIIIFTSPITADLLVSIIKNGDKLKEYEKWLKNMIEIFGEIHHFMDINSITSNLDNYPDDDHYYDNVARLLANKISCTENKNIPSDFGIILNNSNINKYLKSFEYEVKHYKNPLKFR